MTARTPSKPGYDPTASSYPNSDTRRAYMRQYMAKRRASTAEAKDAELVALRAKLEAIGNVLNQYANHPVIRMITAHLASIR